MLLVMTDIMADYKDLIFQKLKYFSSNPNQTPPLNRYLGPLSGPLNKVCSLCPQQESNLRPPSCFVSNIYS